jgi:uncharacterized protein
MTAIHTTYVISVPVFLRYLDRLNVLVDIAEAHATAQRLPAEALLQARLAPDMLPFETQVQITANFALRACFPLAGLAIPAFDVCAPTFPGLRAYLASTTVRLKTLEPAQFDGRAQSLIESQAGKAVIALPATEFLMQYALPNFFFHLTTAYAILRHHGVSIGKPQFDGYHVY